MMYRLARVALAGLWVFAMLFDAWLAYLLCFTATDLGGYVPFAMLVLPMAFSGWLLWIVTKEPAD